jgi:hypothetical protein
VSGKDEVTFAQNWQGKGMRESEFICSKHRKAKNLCCQAEMTSSFLMLLFVSQNPKASEN